MGLTTSTRERRLWIWTGLVLLAVYSTLGLTGLLAGWLQEHGFTRRLFPLGVLLSAIAIAAMAIRLRPRGLELAAWLCVAAAFVLVLARIGIPGERTHLVEYGVVGALVHEALTEHRWQSGRVILPALLAVVLTTIFGAIDEGLQWIIPNRVFDVRDIILNSIAGVMAVTSCVLIRGARRLVTSSVDAPGSGDGAG